MEPTEPQPLTVLPLQERVLGYGMLNDIDNATIDYKNKGESTVHELHFADSEFDALVEKFKENPKDVLSYGRVNLFNIMRDPARPIEKREERAKRYVDAFLNLQLRLDHAAHKPTDEGVVMRGIPPYVMDGLSDLGSDANLQTEDRSRERIRVNKKEIFAQARSLFYDVFTYNLPENKTPEEIKKWIVKNVGSFVYRNMPYDFGEEGEYARSGQTIMLDKIMEQKLAVCRHHALVSQVLLQAFGIESKLVKTDVVFNSSRGAHANNLVRVEGNWYLFDSTNPEVSPDGSVKQCTWKIPEKDIDLSKNNYTWDLSDENGKKVYTTRNNMYWRIRDNEAA